MTMPLLEGTDGVKKMSQSLDNYITITERPEQMFGKLMSVPDHMVGRYAYLAANLDPSEIARLDAAAQAGGPEAGTAKREMARRVVMLYHGDEAAREAEEAFDRLFKQNEAPEEMPEAALPSSAVDGASVYLPRALVELGLAGSRSEARRLISQGGVRINGVPVTEDDQPVEDLVGAVLQVGKRRFVRIT
jgi:tyrosyl-tRNA synthetase